MNTGIALQGGHDVVVGTADVEGGTRLSEIGRFMGFDIERPWGRVGYRSKHWELLGAFDKIDGEAINLNGAVDSPVDRYLSRRRPP